MDQIKEIIKTRTIAYSLIAFIGTAANGLLGTVFFIVLARNLGTRDFGIVSVAITTFILVSDIADLGINSGIINFVSKYRSQNIQLVYKFMNLALKTKLAIWLIVAVVGYISSNFIAQNILLKPELQYSLRLSFLGVGSSLLFSFVTNSLQAFQKFISWSLINISMNGLRLIVVIFLISSLSLNINNSLIVYLTVPFLGFFLGFLVLPKKFLFVSNERSIEKLFFNYNKWIAALTIISAITARLDTFLSTRLLSISQVGIYSVATQLTSLMPQFISSLAVVIGPKLASQDSNQKAWEYFKKVQFFCIGLSVLALLFLPILIFLIPIFYGHLYNQSTNPFIILFVAQLVFLLAIPSHQAIFYYFSKPKVFIPISLGQMLINLSLGYYLISNYQIMGASLTVLIGMLFNFLIPLIWVVKKLKK